MNNESIVDNDRFTGIVHRIFKIRKKQTGITKSTPLNFFWKIILPEKEVISWSSKQMIGILWNLAKIYD
jgi:hypothetical protein